MNDGEDLRVGGIDKDEREFDCILCVRTLCGCSRDAPMRNALVAMTA